MAKIAIIGAGCAGLGAAATLADEKAVPVTATLIEASGRMGGRAQTSTDPAGLPVDLGPQFIQDPDVNPWTAIADKLGFTLKQVSMDGIYRLYQEKKWRNAYTTEGIAAMNNQLDEQYQNALKFKNAPIIAGGPPAEYKGQQDIRLALGSSYLGSIAESAEPWQYVARDQDRQDSVDAGANKYVEGGLGTLVEAYGTALCKRNAPSLAFEPNTIVVGIEAGDEGVSLHTADRRTLGFDFCIVTIPCAEVEKIKFEPPLPGKRVRADEYVRLGSYKKVAFRPTAFPAADDDDLAKSNSIEEGYEYYIYDVVLDGVWQYFRLPTDPTILICVTSGDFARALDGEADDEVAKAVMKLLAKSYPDGDFTPAENKVVVTNWTKTPYVHGAYSYTHYGPDLEPDNPIPYKARKKIGKPFGRVHFAGEATWIEAYGTIHGAYFSGCRAAEQILKAVRLANKK